MTEDQPDEIAAAIDDTTWARAADPDAIRLDVVYDPQLGTIARATDPVSGASATYAEGPQG